MSETQMNESQTQEQTQTDLMQEQHEQQEKQTIAASNAVAPKPSPGMLLAARREELGLSPERVAEQLKMTPRRILDIESDNFAVVDSKAVYRGFVRAYAKVLRMDPEPLVAMVGEDAVLKVNLTPIRHRTLDTFSETRMPFFEKFNIQSKRMAVAIIVVVLLICVLLAQKVGWIPSLPKMTATKVESASASAPVASVPAPAPAEAEKPKVESAVAASVTAPDGEKTKQIDLPPVDVSAQVASVPSAPAAPAPVAVAAPNKSASVVQPAPVSGGKNALVLKCREESWVELKRGNGTVVASRYIPAGTTARFTIDEPMQLTIGNAPAVEATLRGVRLKTHSAGDSKVVRMNVK